MANESTGRNVLVQGRVVWVSGDLFKGKQKTVYGTNQPMVDQQGQPVIEYGFGLAVSKSVLGQTAQGQPGEIWAAMHEEAYSIYPSRQIPPAFAMKYKDGDGIDDQGQPFANRTGYAGCLVFALTTRIQPKFFRFDAATNSNVQVMDGIKCGDWVNVQVNVKAHGAIGQGKPGLYLNPAAAQLIKYDTAIINAPSGDQIFGNTAPPGFVDQPTAPSPGMLVPPPAAPAYGGPPATPQMAPPVAPAAHYGVLPQHHQPQAPVAPPMPPAAPQGYAAPMVPAPNQPAQWAPPQAAPQGYAPPAPPAAPAQWAPQTAAPGGFPPPPM